MRTSPLLLTTVLAASAAGPLLAQEPILLGLSPDRVIVSANALPGTIFDSARPVDVLEFPEIQVKLQATLGETLRDEPGVSATSYGQGASRPVIRGLDANRIRVIQDGLSVLDVSNTSPDHAVAIEPLAASKIEIVRGPAVLLYGTNAVGGLVNATSSRIPRSPVTGLTGSVDASYGTVNDGVSYSGMLEGGYKGFSFHFDTSYRHANNYDIPGFKRSAELRARDPRPLEDEPRDTLPDSRYETKQAGGGVSWAGSRGFIGFGGSAFHTLYGVPGFEEGVSIKLNQKRYESAGQLNQPFPGFRSIAYNFGYAAYAHQEQAPGELGTRFTSKGYEGRLELRNERFMGFEGVLGYQIQRGDFRAVGDESFQAPTRTQNHAFFVFQEIALGRQLRFEVGGRYEYQRVKGSALDLPLVDGFVFPEEPGFVPRRRTLHNFSAAGSLVWTPREDWNLAFSIGYTQRPPTGQETLAFGPHLATDQYEVGTPDLAKEKSLALDLTLRKRAGWVTGSVSGFYYRYSGYVDLLDTGLDFLSAADADGAEVRQFLGRGADANPALAVDLRIPVFRFTGLDADFYGFEAEAQVHLLGPVPSSAAGDRSRARDAADGKTARPGKSVARDPAPALARDLFIDLRGDYVRAETRGSNGFDLPRIPPLRLGAGLVYKDQRLTARVDYRRVFRQDQTAPLETETRGYNDLSASVQYTFASGPVTWTAYVKGANLTDAEQRNHVSYLKEVTPLPGRNVTVGLRASF